MNMFFRKLTYDTVLNNRTNLKSFKFSKRNLNYDSHFVKYLCMLRNISVSDFNITVVDVKNRLQSFVKNDNILQMIKCKFNTCSHKWKLKSNILQEWSAEYENYIIRRLHKSQQMFNAYARILEERLLREFLKHVKLHMNRRNKLLFGATGFSAYNWNAQKISDGEILENASQFDYINILREETIICRKCKKRQVIDSEVPNLTYCKCPCAMKKNQVYIYEDWTPFLERPNLLVWRRPHSSGIYEYKVYGIYDDVSAEDFLKVQIDIKYRQLWDTTAINLEVIESDGESNSDIVYWEMLWPRMFANRDYVFNRRYLIDNEHKLAYIINKSTEHPSCPVKTEKYRVEDYWSCMVIRPIAELDEPGIEFALTYFDNPGVNIPSTVTSWVAMAGMPDFLTRLRQAAKDYKLYCATIRNKDETQPTKPLSSPENEIVSTMPVSVTTESDGNSSYWRYLHPLYYLG